MIKYRLSYDKPKASFLSIRVIAAYVVLSNKLESKLKEKITSTSNIFKILEVIVPVDLMTVSNGQKRKTTFEKIIH